MRRDNDAYYTLQADTAIGALLKYVPIGGHIFEACVGEGHLVQALKQRGRRLITTNDIDLGACADFSLDVSKPFELPYGVDWVVTNPPFSKAFPILKNLLPMARQGVAFLLRLSFLEPTHERGVWLAEHPPNLLIVLPRMSFTGDGKTDSVTCAWMVWYNICGMDHKGIRICPKEEEKCPGK